MQDFIIFLIVMSLPAIPILIFWKYASIREQRNEALIAHFGADNEWRTDKQNRNRLETPPPIPIIRLGAGWTNYNPPPIEYKPPTPPAPPDKRYDTQRCEIKISIK